MVRWGGLYPFIFYFLLVVYLTPPVFDVESPVSIISLGSGLSDHVVFHYWVVDQSLSIITCYQGLWLKYLLIYHTYLLTIPTLLLLLSQAAAAMYLHFQWFTHYTPSCPPHKQRLDSRNHHLPSPPPQLQFLKYATIRCVHSPTFSLCIS